MFPIFVVLPFETPGGIGTIPKIIWTFLRMKERVGENAPRGEREFPFRARTCNNICADSSIAPDSSLHLTKAVLCCGEVVFSPCKSCRTTSQNSPQHQEVCVCAWWRSTAGSESHPIGSRGTDPRRDAAVWECVLLSCVISLNGDRRWQLSSGFSHFEA